MPATSKNTKHEIVVRSNNLIPSGFEKSDANNQGDNSLANGSIKQSMNDSLLQDKTEDNLKQNNISSSDHFFSTQNNAYTPNLSGILDFDGAPSNSNNALPRQCNQSNPDGNQGDYKDMSVRVTRNRRCFFDGLDIESNL